MELPIAPDRCLPVAYQPSTSSSELEAIALILKTLGDPARLTILQIVAAAKGEMVCACVFPDALGVSQPTASHHLKKLVEAGLLEREQRGKWAYFRLTSPAFERAQAFLEPLLEGAPASTGS